MLTKSERDELTPWLDKVYRQSRVPVVVRPVIANLMATCDELEVEVMRLRRQYLEAERGRRIAEAVLREATLGADYSLCIEEAGRQFDERFPAWFGEEARDEGV